MAAMRSVSRRRFLKILAVSSAAGIAMRVRDGFPDRASADLPTAVHTAHLLMGAIVNLTLVSDDPAQAQAATTAALAGMRRLANLFNRFDPASQLSQLNAQGVLRTPDPALVALLHQADAVSQASQGAFDVSIKPLLDLYLAGQGKRLPSGSDIRAALRQVGYAQIRYDSREIGFARPGMSLTLDGIAKGAVIDGGVSILHDYGFNDVIVEAGGDLLAAGTHGAHIPWTIGLRAPRGQTPLAMPRLRVQDRAVATSGDYLHAFTPDFSAHHILDPRRGISAPELASVTVVAPAAVLADALATAVMVAGPQAGISLLRRFPGCEAYVLDKQLQAIATAGLAAYLA